MSAKTSGADASNGGAARSREHNQGNQGRGCTPEQKAAVLRIRRCRATAFYEILAVEASCSDAEIKKAYRKQSLLTHPDKNGHEHADEAFKMVARAFSVLGDKEKRDKFDRFGTDPDSRFDSARQQQQQQQQNPFAGFANRQRATGGGGGGFGGGFDEEISPEEMFRRFFGGGGFGGPFGGGFDTGPQFVFNMGGGPGIRVHQFGGGRPRRRPRDGADPQQQQQQAEASILSTVIGLLPVIFLFIIPLITSLFSGPTAPAVPDVVFDMPLGAHSHRQVHETGLNFFVREEDWARIRENKNKVSQLHQQAYVTFVNRLKRECEQESHQQQRLHEAAQGWFYVDQDMLDRARSHPKPSCSRLERLLRGNGKPDGQQQGKTKAS